MRLVVNAATRKIVPVAAASMDLMTLKQKPLHVVGGMATSVASGRGDGVAAIEGIGIVIINVEGYW